jgi:hypothetical protein
VCSFTLKKSVFTFPYRVQDHVLKHVSQQKDLGVVFDSRMTFAQHIQYILRKSTRALGLLQRFLVLTDSAVLALFFKSCVLSIITYCAPIWLSASKTNVRKLNAVYSYFICIMKHRIPLHRVHSTCDVFAAYKILPLENILNYCDILLLHAVLNGRVYAPLLLSNLFIYAPKVSLRSRQYFFLPKARISLQQRLLFWHLPSLFNSLSLSIKSALDITSPIFLFKSDLKRLLHV